MIQLDSQVVSEVESLDNSIESVYKSPGGTLYFVTDELQIEILPHKYWDKDTLNEVTIISYERMTETPKVEYRRTKVSEKPITQITNELEKIII